MCCLLRQLLWARRRARERTRVASGDESRVATRRVERARDTESGDKKICASALRRQPPRLQIRILPRHLRRVRVCAVVLKPRKPSMLADAARFVYAIGVEGSNHHGVMSELLQPLAAERCSQNCSMHLAVHTDAWAKQPDCAVHADTDELRGHLFGGRLSTVKDSAGVRQLLHRDHSAVWLEDNSFPSGWPHGFFGGRHPPAPMDIIDMFNTLQGIATTKIVVLVRDFTSTVLSHSRFDHGLVPHAEVLATYNAYIAKSIAQLPASSWYVLPVDCLYRSAQARQRVARDLRAFLGWKAPNIEPRDACCNCFARWHGSRHANRQSPSAVAVVQQVLTNRSAATAWGPLAPREWDCPE